VEKPDKNAESHGYFHSGSWHDHFFSYQEERDWYVSLKKVALHGINYPLTVFVSAQFTGSNVFPVSIESSFNVNRILYSLLEHAFQVRPDDTQKKVQMQFTN
jgi:glycyl-tRNA synthetase (class II)